MSLSRKHYCAVAAILSIDRDLAAQEMKIAMTLDTIAHRMADYFEMNNPNFDRSRFLAACKVAS